MIKDFIMEIPLTSNIYFFLGGKNMQEKNIKNTEKILKMICNRLIDYQNGLLVYEYRRENL